jgi:hypothetical protein
VVWCAGINSGVCITGDAECNGDPNASGFNHGLGSDYPQLSQGEFLLVVFDFGLK